jgi:hypothetical protein
MSVRELGYEDQDYIPLSQGILTLDSLKGT